MIGLIQRVSQASVVVSGVEIAQIDQGLLVLLGVEKEDDTKNAEKLIHKILGYRVFEDTAGKMNLSVGDVGGEVLLVPQFTLAADTRNGMRPGFSAAASPQDAQHWFNYAVQKTEQAHEKTQSGKFGAHMKVSLLNDGPVTFWLQT